MWGRGITEHCVKVNYNSVVRGYAPSRNVLNLGSLKLLLEPVADEMFGNYGRGNPRAPPFCIKPC